MKEILIVDDDRDLCTLLDKFLQKNGFRSTSVYDGESAINLLKKERKDLVICDFKLPDYSGLEILQKIKIIDPSILVIIITGYSDVKIAVESLKKGAVDYVTKPIYPEEILKTIEESLEKKKDPGSYNKISKTQKVKFISGSSPQSKTIEKHIELIAPTDLSVIVEGDTGTGKEVVAQKIHEKSPRSVNDFVAIDCGALPKDIASSELFGHVKGAFTGALQDKKGCFELAQKGTLFLDEISNLTYDNQIKLLRVLQERVIRRIGGDKDIKVDVRIIVATNKNLKEAVHKGEFRQDIYHRLNEFRIEIPPLRERPDDIMVFAKHFLDGANKDLNKKIKGFDQQVEEKFRNYTWWGNLRELRNVIKRAALVCQNNKITLSCLPQEIKNPLAPNQFNDSVYDSATDLKSIAEQAEKNAILKVLKRTDFNKTKTAEILKIDRKTLYNKLKTYNIDL